jgi:hypothetical protein
VSGIHRFILKNAKGKVIDVNAPRPSEKRIVNLFDN